MENEIKVKNTIIQINSLNIYVLSRSILENKNKTYNNKKYEEIIFAFLILIPPIQNLLTIIHYVETTAQVNIACEADFR